MSDQPTGQEPQDEQLNEQGVGLGMDDEPNTFEPEEEPEATEESDGDDR